MILKYILIASWQRSYMHLHTSLTHANALYRGGKNWKVVFISLNAQDQYLMS